VSLSSIITPSNDFVSNFYAVYADTNIIITIPYPFYTLSSSHLEISKKTKNEDKKHPFWVPAVNRTALFKKI